MNILERISQQIYEPYGSTQFYKLLNNEKVIFITKLDSGNIYDISYSNYEWLDYEYNELLILIRNTSYRVCSRNGLERYLKINWNHVFPWNELVY